jgi:hypothetical protein
MLRQGDVYLISAAIPDGTTTVARDNGRVILAYGEVTGHSHAIAAPEATLVRTVEDERFLRIVGSAVDLVHEEHATITVAPGEYRVVIGREFTADMAAERVID